MYKLFQEDSIIINKSSIERGMGSITYYKNYSDEITSRGTEEEVFEKPVDTKSSMFTKINHLAPDGLPYLGANLKENDCIIGKTAKVRHLATKRDRSTYLKAGQTGVVDRVCMSITNEGKRRTTVRLRRQMPIKEADKLASVHGQKGTVGKIVPQVDMPFSVQTGMVPDLIISPHAIPSRMTIGQLLEMIGGKLKAISGEDIDATAFTNVSAEDIGNRLKKFGYSSTGNERFICGKSGRLMDCSIFVGPTSYQRLRHIASMKIHSRSTGAVTILTRQPLEGRSRGGGLRFGVSLFEFTKLISYFYF